MLVGIGLIVSASGDDVLLVNKESPIYMAVMMCWGGLTASVDVWKVACGGAEMLGPRLPVPIGIELSRKTTTPVGIPNAAVAGATLAVNVTS
jgi:hypothetical protein